jgi:lipopolysaccharide transport protein LptA
LVRAEDESGGDIARLTMPTKRLRIPIQYYENGRIRVQLFADEALISLRETTFARGVRVEFYTESGALDGQLSAPECEYGRRNQKVRARGGARLEKRGIVATCGDLKWEIEKEEMTLYETGRVFVARGTLGAEAAAQAAGLEWTPGQNPDDFGTNRLALAADRIEYDLMEEMVQLSGNVQAEDPGMRVEADRATAFLRGPSALKSVVASGNVRLWRGQQAASCRKALYLGAAREVVLLGDVGMAREEDAVAAGMVTYRLDDDRMECHNAVVVVAPRRGRGPGLTDGVDGALGPVGRRKRDG